MPSDASSPSSDPSLWIPNRVPILLTSVLIIAVCGILYELLISSISSYFQGSSILHFSLVIGLFLSFMGVGSYVSKFIQKDLLPWFIRFEIVLSVVGGLSTFLLYFAFSLTPYFYGVAFLLIAILGSLIGVEIPILTRIVREHESLRDAMAKVLSFDYLGSLIASVVFPLVLLPNLGVMRTAFAIGMLNLTVAILNTWLFRAELPQYKRMLTVCTGIGALLIAGFVYSFQLVGFFESFLYRDQVLLSKQSVYQKIVVTKWNKDLRLFIDGNLQFSSRDEYRYHEPLVHLPMALAASHERILVLGGGDGLACRDILQYPDIQQIEVIDLDPAITDLGTKHPVFTQLNHNALNDPRVTIINTDAYKYIENSSDLYDVVIIDLPDPNNVSLGKLYSAEFYGLLKKRLSAGATIITQSTSPYYAPNAFWCIHETLKSVFPSTLPLTAFVPTFGQWGFNLAMNDPGRLKPAIADSIQLSEQAVMLCQQRLFASKDRFEFRYLNPDVLSGLFQFDEDSKSRPVIINRLDNQALVEYYEKSWDAWR
ncbi:MAG: polyamine aminopropyltransferase [Bacteroidota bacterium]